jgi:hypothetical protein
MRRSRPGLFSALIAVAAMLLVWASIRGEAESQLHIVPLDRDFLESDSRDLRVFILSADEVLVEVLPPSQERFAARPSFVLGAKGALPLWFMPGQLPDEFLSRDIREGGVEVVHASEERVVFRAEFETAYRLDLLGYQVARVRFTELSRLAATPDTRPLHESLIAAHPLTRARLDFMKAMSESASADSLRGLIYWLNYDSTAGEYRSRFAARYDLDEDVTPVLYDMLRTYMEPVDGRAYTDEFSLLRSSQYLGQASRGTNVWGEMPGSRTSAYYIICGHFDATASRDSGFSSSWDSTYAPGADDNATGTATVMECARLIAPLSLDFGVKFVLFSAEENLGLGNLQGSGAFVDSLSEADSIIGVINVDMIGYMEDYRKCEVSHGWRSEWLSSELEATAESLGLETGFEAFERADVRNSDHASFWQVGVPALMLSERTTEDVIPIYPYYHSSSDTLGNVDMAQVRDNVALIVGYMSRFADIPGDSLSDLEVTRESVEMDWDGRSTRDPFIAGEELTLTVRALNTGGAMDGARTYAYKIWSGKSESGPLVYENEVELDVVSGGTAVATTTWTTEATVYGEVFFTVSLLPTEDDVESDVTNNTTTVSLDVVPRQTVLRDFHVYPNPTGDPANARMTGDILTSRTDFLANYVAQVFDVTGLRLLKGEGQLTSPELDVPLSDFAGNASQLSPGLYICIIDMNVRDEAQNVKATTRFGVVSGQ